MIYFLFIYFISASAFGFQNLPAHKNHFIKNCFKYENKNKIIIKENYFFMQVQSLHHVWFCEDGQRTEIYSKLIDGIYEMESFFEKGNGLRAKF